MCLYLDRDDYPDEVKWRHIERYLRAIRMAGVRGGTWLDIGCGSGYGTAMMMGFAGRAVGMDEDEEAIGYAKVRWPAVTEFVRRDAAAGLGPLRRAYAPFRAIFLVEILEHLKEQAVFLRTIWGWLERDGVLLITCPRGNGEPVNPKHVHEPTAEELVELLVESGYEVTETHSHPYVSSHGEDATQLYVRAVTS